MGTLLLHDPVVQFYLLYVAALVVACIWDSLRYPPAFQDDSRTPRKEVAQGPPGLFPSAASQNPPRSVSRPGRGAAKQVEPIREGRRLQAPTDPIPTPSSTNRREYHVVAP
jgi:hypothetical protein